MKIGKILLIIMILLVIPTTISINSETEPWERSEVSFKKEPIKFYLRNRNECVLKDVHVTAYTSHPDQTDSSPFTAAWNNKLHPTRDKLKVIAVSRDLLKEGLDNGDYVLIVKDNSNVIKCIVKDKMNKRFENRIDLYFGTDRDRALEFGTKDWSIIYRK